MKIELISLDSLIPFENNPRKGLNVDKVAASIKEFGFQQPVVINKNKIILAGHTRYFASKKLNLTEVPCIIAELNELKQKAYRIADNKVAQDNYWDFDKLELEFNNLLDNNYDLINTGFDKAELDNLINKTIKDENDSDNEITEKNLEPANKCPSCGYEYD